MPVSVGGMDVAPGDLIHMDENGAVKFPAVHAPAIVKNSRAMLDDEARRSCCCARPRALPKCARLPRAAPTRPRRPELVGRSATERAPAASPDRFGMAAKLFAILLLLGAVAVLITGALATSRRVMR